MWLAIAGDAFSREGYATCDSVTLRIGLKAAKTSISTHKRACHRNPVPAWRYTETMARKASVVIEKDEHGFYAWCPELKGCQSQGDTLESTMVNIREAIELYLETLPSEERDGLLSREILTTTVEVNA